MKRRWCPDRQFTGGRLIFYVAAALAAGLLGMQATATDAPSQNSADIESGFPNQMLADQILDQAVLNPDGDQIGEIANLMIDRSGNVAGVIVSVEDFQKVKVPFDQLQFEGQWEYRSVRGQGGIEHRIPWRQRPVITFMGSRQELKDLPRFRADRRFPRGSATGWGIYSYPDPGPGDFPE